MATQKNVHTHTHTHTYIYIYIYMYISIQLVRNSLFQLYGHVTLIVSLSSDRIMKNISCMSMCLYTHSMRNPSVRLQWGIWFGSFCHYNVCHRQVTGLLSTGASFVFHILLASGINCNRDVLENYPKYLLVLLTKDKYKRFDSCEGPRNFTEVRFK